ncbi:HEAT repeat domain-containing protein [Nodosilinea sp. LEGE 07088]|uniref:HEAT repeat domain-containing protein n=1 Tax=Nodosilinea sp. LEGE 07088 TaxID=2777968 RepID=UPI00187FB63C|nr:HEAT repeat domain-containing protein [Nodosilinea sp. LEGE 07088]MBE9139678.1 HEAT repeat domain-containing protein [Nodosilinea sp. LEGE 07088]
MPPLEDLLQQCTVKITVPGGWGTGFFVAPGLILTCAHVVRKAADSQVTVSYPAWQQPLSAIVKAKADDGKTLDLALVELSEPSFDHPCVLLDEEPVAIGQTLYSYGYLESYTNAAPVRPVNEGLTGDTPPLLKLQGAQIEKGISGAALLNLKSEKVCGMVKETRAAGFDLGGGAIPTRVILEQFPELRELQQQFHGGDPCGNGKAARRWLNLITQPEIDFQPYLNSIVTTYVKWQQYYTLTHAEGKQRQVEESAPPTFDFGFDFGLMVQTVLKEEREQPQQEKPAKERVERFSVLDGLRKYALAQKPEPVLLVGRPGSGKSTALAKLLLEEAIAQKSEAFKPSNFSPSPHVPILVELRYWQGSLSDLIHNAITRHDLALKAVPLERLLTNALLLFDGVNELPSYEAQTELSAFRHNHPNLPMIFTTRDLSLGGDLGIERKLEMLPLTEPQMQAFVRAYIPEQAEAMLRQLKDRLREFGQTPLLLWMLCEVFQQAPNHQLPSNLGGVFQAFTQMYETSSVRKHEVALLKGDVRPLSDRRLWKKALMAIAAIMMQGKTPVDFRVAIHRDEAERELNRIFPTETFPVRDILDDLLKYHLLQNRSADQIEFRHQLLQEYYAAEYLLRLLPNMTDDQLKQDYLNYLKWTEPLALMLALVDSEAQAIRVVQYALQVDLRLGARLAGEVSPAFQQQTIQFVEALKVPTWLKVQLLEETQSAFSITGLLEAIEDSDFNVRRSATGALGKLNSEEAIPGLLKALEDSDFNVHENAAKALGKLGSEKAIPGLLKALEDSNLNVARSAAQVLGELGFDAAVPGLLNAIKGSDYDMCLSAAGALENLGSDAAILGLLNTLESPNRYDRGIAAVALGELGFDAAVPGLLNAIEHLEDYEVRRSAAQVLGRLGSDAAITWMFKAIEHPHSYVFWRAAEALGNLGSEAAVPGLLNALECPHAEVRRSAAEALGKLGFEAAIPGLLNVIKDSNDSVRRSVVGALEKLGSEAAIPGLLKALEDSNDSVRRSAIGALGKLGSEAAIPGLLKALEDSNDSVRRSAIGALGKLGSEAAIPGLLNAFKDSNDSVRRSVAEALGKLGCKAAIPSLIDALKDSNVSVRGNAAGALGKLGSEAAIPGLLKALEDSNGSARGSSAAEALGKLGFESAIPGLLKALECPHAEVRRSAAGALGTLGSEAAIPGLLEALEDSDYSVRRSAAGALGKLGSEAAIPGLLNALEDSDYSVRRSATEALSNLAKKHPEASASHLPHLVRLTPTTAGPHSDLVILEIQGNCKFYNYEIFQTHLAAHEAERQTCPNSDSNAITIQTLERLTIMTDQAPIFNQQHATIGVNYAAEGSTIEFTQHTSSSEQIFEILLTDYQQFIQQLQQKYPNLADPTTVPQIIEVEAKLIEAQDQERWQNFLNLKRLWNGSKKAGIKVGEHFAENNVWAKGAVAFLEGVSEDAK